MRELKIKRKTGREILITKKEQDRNASVTKQSTTDEFKKNAKEMQKVEVDSEGKAKPIIQQRRIQVAKPGSGKKTIVYGEDRSVLYELEPGSDKEKAILQKIRLQERDTNNRRTRASEVMNYQTGDTDNNRVFEERYDAQNSRKPAKKVIVKK
jgi:hypothetical protein